MIARVAPELSLKRAHRFDMVLQGLTAPALVLTRFTLFDALYGSGNLAVVVALKSDCKVHWRLYTEIGRNSSRVDAGDANRL